MSQIRLGQYSNQEITCNLLTSTLSSLLLIIHSSFYSLIFWASELSLTTIVQKQKISGIVKKA